LALVSLQGIVKKAVWSWWPAHAAESCFDYWGIPLVLCFSGWFFILKLECCNPSESCLLPYLFRKSLAKHFKVETSNISSMKVGYIWKHSGNWKATSKCSVKFYLHSRLDLQFLSTLLIKEFIDKCRFCWVAVMHCNMLP
jgi:hypothetical protein